MKILLYIVGALLLFVVYPALVSAWTTISLIPHVETKDYLLLVQITITFLTTVGLALISLAGARSTEALRAQLALTVNEATEKLRAELQQRSEDIKARIGQIVPREHEAYHAMWKAASDYFRALQHLQDGEYPEKEITQAEESCKEAVGKSLLAQQEDIDSFYQFWQSATYLKDRASSDRGRRAALIKLWDDEGRQFGVQYSDLRDRFIQAVRAK